MTTTIFFKSTLISTTHHAQSYENTFQHPSDTHEQMEVQFCSKKHHKTSFSVQGTVLQQTIILITCQIRYLKMNSRTFPKTRIRFQQYLQTISRMIFLSAAILLTILPASAQDSMTLVLDWFVNPNHGPIIIAKENGYFTEQGLEVRIIAPTNPTAPTKMAAAGRVDMAISYQPQHHLQVAAGIPLIRVGTLVGTPLSCILTLKDGPVEKITDLQGRKIGFSVAGIDEIFLSSILETNGLSINSITLVNVNWSLASALMSKQVDAVIGAFRNFEMQQLHTEGIAGRCLHLEEIGIPAYDELIYVVNPKTMNIKIIRKFLSATEKAARFIINYPQKSWIIFRNTSAELQDTLNKQSWMYTIPYFALRPAALNGGRYAQFELFLHKIGAVKRIHTISELAIDPGMIEHP